MKTTPKKKMQNVSFSSIDEFFEFLPDDELKIVNYLRRLIITSIPDITEKLSFNVPFYKYHTNICFIWPGSVSWGNVTQKGVRLGFTTGYLLTDEHNYLEKGDRKQVYWKDIYDVKEIDPDLIRSFLFEALLIDQQKAAEKGRGKKVGKGNIVI